MIVQVDMYRKTSAGVDGIHCIGPDEVVVEWVAAMTSYGFCWMQWTVLP